MPNIFDSYVDLSYIKGLIEGSFRDSPEIVNVCRNYISSLAQKLQADAEEIAKLNARLVGLESDSAALYEECNKLRSEIRELKNASS